MVLVQILEESTLYLSSLETAIKKQSSACLFFYKQPNGYVALYGDATEVSFCTGLSIKINRRHLSDEATNLFIPFEKLEWVIARMMQCGNPVALIDSQTGEVQTFWPAPMEPVGEQEFTEPMRSERHSEVETACQQLSKESIFSQSDLQLAAFSIETQDMEVPF